jgi:MFS family permease
MTVTETFWLKAVSRPGRIVFAIMFALESFARALLSTIVPLQAYALLQAARDVSILNTVVGLVGLGSSFAIPFLIRRFRRRWVYTAGLVALILACALLGTHTLVGQVGGMLFRAFAVAAIYIALTLYVLDHVRRKDLIRLEPLRLGLSTVSWSLGPVLGVWLYERVELWAPEALSAATATILIGYFWYLRLHENPAVAAATRPPPNPFRTIRRFLAQPRLRLGWFIPFSRSTWWAMLYVYPLIYLVQAGKGETLGGLVVSACNALLALAPLFGKLAGRTGIRRPIIGAFICCGVFTVAAGLLYDHPYLVCLAILLGAVPCVMLDTVGNIPFMRAVRPLERPQMTTVFRTYIDLSDLLPGVVYSVLLTFFDIRAVFFACGLYMFVAALVARYLPKRL